MSSRRLEPDAAFTLWECTLAVAISGILVSLVCQAAVNLFAASSRAATRGEQAAMSASVHRIFTEDMHSTTSASVVGGVLYITKADGTQFHYSVNANGQLIRYQSSGGTSVIANQVSTESVALSGSIVHIKVDFQGGASEVMDVAWLQSLTP